MAGNNSVFSSKRERRLWLSLVIVMAAIYATLGHAPALLAALSGSLLDITGDNLVLALLITLVALPVFFVKQERSRMELAVMAGIFAVCLLAWLRLGSAEARTHLFEYGMVAALIHEALLERRANGRHAPSPALLALLLTILLGWLDEGIQSTLPNRVYDLMDVAFNTLAAITIIGARQLHSWATARLRRQRQEVATGE